MSCLLESPGSPSPRPKTVLCSTTVKPEPLGTEPKQQQWSHLQGSPRSSWADPTAAWLPSISLGCVWPNARVRHLAVFLVSLTAMADEKAWRRGEAGKLIKASLYPVLLTSAPVTFPGLRAACRVPSCRVWDTHTCIWALRLPGCLASCLVAMRLFPHLPSRGHQMSATYPLELFLCAWFLEIEWLCIWNLLFLIRRCYYKPPSFCYNFKNQPIMYQIL